MPVKYVELDLREPLRPIYIDTKYEWLCVIVKHERKPLGVMNLHILPHEREIGLERLRNEISQWFGWQLFEDAIAGAFNSDDDIHLPPISVIVCTRDRPHSLERALEPLKHLDYPQYEVIVIDNASKSTMVKEVIERAGFRCVREDKPGLDRARNRGVKEAQFDIVAYIDDDTLASSGWLRGIAEGFANPRVMGVTGLVLPAEIETRAQLEFEQYGGMSKGFRPFTISREGLSDKTRFATFAWGLGGNMAFRRSLFNLIGGFDVALDVGTPTNGAGDLEFFYRLVSNGYLLRYEPSAMIRHTHRRDHETFVKQIYNNGRGLGSYLLTVVRNERHNRKKVMRYAVRDWMLPWFGKRFIQSVMKRDTWTRKLVLAEFKGALSAPRAYLRSQKSSAQLNEK